jgi:hypothetical protein
MQALINALQGQTSAPKPVNPGMAQPMPGMTPAPMPGPGMGQMPPQQHAPQMGGSPPFVPPQFPQGGQPGPYGGGRPMMPQGMPGMGGGHGGQGMGRPGGMQPFANAPNQFKPQGPGVGGLIGLRS